MQCGQIRLRAICRNSTRSVASRRTLLESRFAAGQGYSSILASSRYLVVYQSLYRSYPRAPTRVSPHSSFSGDQIYAYVGVVFVMAPLTPVKLQGYGPVRFPTSDRDEIWICYSARCVAPSQRFASRSYVWLRCLGLGLSCLVRRRGAVKRGNTNNKRSRREFAQAARLHCKEAG
jgi:hypothetical protein